MPGGPRSACEHLEISGIVEQDGDRLAESLGGLDDAGFVEADPAADAYRLAHPLFVTVLLNDMTESRAGAWHGRIFNGLSQLGDAVSTGLAFHAVRSLRRPPNIVELLQDAARAAAEAGIYPEAADWYRRVAELSSDEETAARALIGRATALEHFDAAAAARLYASLLANTEALQERVRILTGHARVLRMLNRHAEALGALDQALADAVGDDAWHVRQARAVIFGLDGTARRRGTRASETM